MRRHAQLRPGSLYAVGDNLYATFGSELSADDSLQYRWPTSFRYTGAPWLSRPMDGLDVGPDSHGQLGNGTTTDSLVPIQVLGVADVVAVAGGHTRNSAVKADGRSGNGEWISQTGKRNPGTSSRPVECGSRRHRLLPQPRPQN